MPGMEWYDRWYARQPTWIKIVQPASVGVAGGIVITMLSGWLAAIAVTLVVVWIARTLVSVDRDMRKARTRVVEAMPQAAAIVGKNVGPVGYDPSWDDIEVNGLVLFYDRKGKPISLRQFAAYYENQGYRFLHRDVVNGIEVVTAWMGTDPDGYDPPRVFGSMILGRTHSERLTCTEDEAFMAHYDLVEQVHAEEREGK